MIKYLIHTLTNSYYYKLSLILIKFLSNFINYWDYFLNIELKP